MHAQFLSKRLKLILYDRGSRAFFSLSRVHCFVLFLLFLEVFLLPSFPVYFFSFIPKAVIFLVVIRIVVCGFADSVEPLKKWLISILQFSKNQSLFTASSHSMVFLGGMPEHGPPFVCTGVAFTSQTS